MSGMSMRRAFNRRMLSELTRFTVSPGSYDENNNWIQGKTNRSSIFGVIVSGNKFSQFEEGISKHIDEGGERFSNFWSLYVINQYSLEVNDKVYFHGDYYNVIQQSDQQEFGFKSYLIEKSERWSP